MKYILIILLIMLIILFIPIPLSLTAYYSSEDYFIKLYTFNIFSKNKFTKKNNKSIKKNINPPHKKGKIKSELKALNIKSLIHKYYHAKFKGSIKIKLHMDYSLDDAYKTAILFGALNNLSYTFYFISSILFKVKKYDFKLNPQFSNGHYFKIAAKSIIFISFAEIIYIIAILIKSLRTSKEVSPK